VKCSGSVILLREAKRKMLPRGGVIPVSLLGWVVLFGGVVAGTSIHTVDIDFAARALQPGELVVLTFTFDAEPVNVRATAFGRSIPVFPENARVWRALFGIDLDQRTGPGDVVVEAQVGDVPVREVHRLVVRPKQFAVRTLKVPTEFVNPPESVQSRIESETAFLTKVYDSSAAERLWHEPFVRPVPDEANSRFGTRSRFNGQLRSPHSGADFLSGLGTPVKAPNAGRVVAARDLYFSGNTVILDHGLGVFSMLAHLSRIDVQEQNLVEPGQIVGLVGATGRVTGPHLHWAMRVSGARVDPLSTLALLGRKNGQ
jgi:murein DD-endopeptidase MepM/ murein hydrolase activator NlpD